MAGEAETLTELADAHQVAGYLSAARTALQRALTIHLGMEHPATAAVEAKLHDLAALEGGQELQAQ